MRLEVLENVVLLSTALFGVFAKQYGPITAGVVGLSVSYSLNMTNVFDLFLRTLTYVEADIVSVERILFNVGEEVWS